jgi:hypothetical protein
MPLETVIGTSLNYYLIAFDADGKERAETELVSKKVLDILSTEPITDVFFITHGWMGDIPAARDQYNRWIKAMAISHADIERVKQVRPNFRPLLIGLHWPSKPWGDEKIVGVSFDVSDNSQEESINQYAQQISDTETSREALRVIFSAAAEYDAPPDNLPPEVRQAYEVLIKEASLNADTEDGENWNETELLSLDPQSVYQSILAEETEEVSFGFSDTLKSTWDSFLGVPRLISFWKMKDRARQIGGTSGFNLLNKMQQVAPSTAKFHLIGHSFGCIFSSAAVLGNKQNNALLRPINSLVLIQGALSLWSFSANIPHRKGLIGYFNPIIAQKKVAGAIVTTQSEHDNAVRLAYPIAGNLGLLGGQDINFDVSSPSYPPVGGIGTYGIQGTDLDIVNMNMLSLQEPYKFQPHRIYNLESSQYIYDPHASFAMGAHNAFDKPEVAHAVWSAVLAS